MQIPAHPVSRQRNRNPVASHTQNLSPHTGILRRYATDSIPTDHFAPAFFHLLNFYIYETGPGLSQSRGRAASDHARRFLCNADARQAGYRIHLDFLWVPALAVTSGRVMQRVKKGGHNIPPEVQERRFTVGLRNLFHLYRPLVDHWRLFDNSGPEPFCVAEEKEGMLLVHVPSFFDSLPERP